MHRTLSLAAIVAIAIACSGGREPEQIVDRVARSRHGDTVFIQTRRDGVWGAPHDAIEVKRISGGSKEATFGSVLFPTATPDGGVVLFDSKSLDGMITRQFDSNGVFVRNIGHQGAGPGEYTGGYPVVLGAYSNGTILLRDGQRVVNRYTPDGRFINGFPLAQLVGGTFELIPAVDGSIFMRSRGPSTQPRAWSNFLPPMLRFDSTGRVLDSIMNPKPWLVPPESPSRFTAREQWSVVPSGDIVYGRTDILGFLIADPAKKRPPLVASIENTPVPYLDDERKELEAIEDFQQKNLPPEQRPPRRPVPQTKAPLRGLMTDGDGRIWLFKSTTGQKIPPVKGAVSNNASVTVTYDEPVVLDAFQADGTFLGEVRFPMGARVSMSGNTAWAIISGADDVPTLVKYRLH